MLSSMRRKPRLLGNPVGPRPTTGCCHLPCSSRMANQPLIEGWFATVEPVEEVIAGQQLRTDVGH